MQEEFEDEYSEVKDKRSGNFMNLFQSMVGWQFILVIVLVIILAFMWNDKADKMQMFILVFAIVMIVLYSQKTAPTKLISEEVAKRIAIETIEEKRDEDFIKSGLDVRPTDFCFLQYQLGIPIKWHVGIKVETRLHKINYWRVMIHPYDGVVIGIVNEPTGFEGREKEVQDIMVVNSRYFVEE